MPACSTLQEHGAERSKSCWSWNFLARIRTIDSTVLLAILQTKTIGKLGTDLGRALQELLSGYRAPPNGMEDSPHSIRVVARHARNLAMQHGSFLRPREPTRGHSTMWRISEVDGPPQWLCCHPVKRSWEAAPCTDPSTLVRSGASLSPEVVEEWSCGWVAGMSCGTRDSFQSRWGFVSVVGISPRASPTPPPGRRCWPPGRKAAQPAPGDGPAAGHGCPSPRWHQYLENCPVSARKFATISSDSVGLVSWMAARNSCVLARCLIPSKCSRSKARCAAFHAANSMSVGRGFESPLGLHRHPH
jgi:hypothetical protein